MSGGWWFVVGWIAGSVGTALAIGLVMDRELVRARRARAFKGCERPRDD